MTKTNSQIREDFRKEFCVLHEEKYLYWRNTRPFNDINMLPTPSEVLEFFLSKLDSLLKQQREEIEKAFGGCKKCYGKGYATEKTGHSGRIGINGKRESWVIDNINPCSCDRGKQIINLIKEYKE